MPRAILFDLDNTLIDRDAAMRDLLDETLRTAGFGPEVLPEVLARDDSGLGDRPAFFAWLAQAYPVFGTTGEETGRRLLTALADRVRPDPQANDLVDALASDYALAVVTNGGSKTQRTKVERAELSERFEHILVSGEVGCDKPEVGIFAEALRLVDCAAGDALFVGDNPVADIAGAAAVGMQTCWVARGRTYPNDLPQPSFTVEHVRELSELLA